MGFGQIAVQHTVDFNDDLVVALCEIYAVNGGVGFAVIQLYVQWTIMTLSSYPQTPTARVEREILFSSA